MSFIVEFRGSKERFKDRIKELQDLLKEYHVKDFRTFIHLSKINPTFHSRWGAIWSNLLRDEGGKLSLMTIGLILGAVFGGVGITAIGGAFGIPGLIAGGAIGLFCGTEVDAVIRKSSKK